MIERISLLHQRVVYYPRRIQNTKRQLKEIAQRGDGVNKAVRSTRTRHAVVRILKAVEGREYDIERDQRKRHPLDDRLLPLSREQPNQRLRLGEPEKRIGNDANDLEARAAHNLQLHEPRILNPPFVLLLGNDKRVSCGDCEGDGDGQRRNLLQPRTPTNIDTARGAIVREPSTSAEVDDAAVEERAGCDEEHDDKHVGCDGRGRQGIAHGELRSVERVTKVGDLVLLCVAGCETRLVRGRGRVGEASRRDRGTWHLEDGLLGQRQGCEALAQLDNGVDG